MTATIEAVIPHLVVDDAMAALEFYKQALGAEEVMRLPAEDGKRLMHSEMKLGEARVFVRDAFSDRCAEGQDHTPKTLGGSAVTLHLRVADCDAALDRAVKAGALVVMPAEDMFWGDRFAVVTDPYGHAWSFAHALQNQTAENQPA